MKKVLSLVLSLVMAFSAVQLAVVSSAAAPAAYVASVDTKAEKNDAPVVIAAADAAENTEAETTDSGSSYMFSISLIKDIIAFIQRIKAFINNGLPGLPEFVQNIFKKDKVK